MDDKILNDGGLVRNIPIDVARDLCADHVIVVNLVEPSIDPKRLRTATQLLSRTMDVMIEANETLQLQTIREGDIRIDVHMGDITTADFERVPDTVPLGEAATREHAAAARAVCRARGAIRGVAHEGDPVAGTRGAARRGALRRPGARESGVPGGSRQHQGRRQGRQHGDQHRSAAHGGAAGFRLRGLPARRRSRGAHPHLAAARKELGS